MTAGPLLRLKSCRLSGQSPHARFKLLLVLVALQVSLTLLLHVISLAGWFSSLHDGRGVWKFAMDSSGYYQEMETFAEYLRVNGVEGWLVWTNNAHMKPYALLLVLLGSPFLSALLINALLYLAGLALLFRIGRLLFDHRVAAFSTVTAALLPSYLLHSTQLLPDPLFVAAQLALICGLLQVMLTSGAGSLATGFLLIVGGVFTSWTVRFYMAEFNVLVLVLGVLLLTSWRSLRERVPNLVVAGLALGSVLWVLEFEPLSLQLQGGLRVPDDRMAVSPERSPSRPGPEATAVSSIPGDNGAPALARRLVELLARFRDSFRQAYSHAGSNIDTDVTFRTLGDVIAYLPRAWLIGFTAPFPSMWLTSGFVTGQAGRLVSGMEMLALYALIPLAGLGVWRERRRLPVLFVALVVLLGITAFSLVVTNVGALFRLRAVFWLLMMPLAMAGVLRLFRGRPGSRDPSVSGRASGT